MSLRLTCIGDGDPAPDYKWVHGHDGRETEGAVLELTNLKVNQAVDYTCVVNNSIFGVLHTDSQFFSLGIGKRSSKIFYR